jgi:hypothetical protein
MGFDKLSLSGVGISATSAQPEPVEGNGKP